MPYIKDNLPYKVPYQIYVDPSNLCNFKCNFCPTGDKKLLKSVNRPAGMMNLKVYEKFVLDLKSMIDKYKQKTSSIMLFKDGEPLMNPLLPKMINILNEYDLSDTLHITTNGSLLSKELSEKLIKAGLKEIRFSIYGVNDETYKRNTNRNISYKSVKKNIKDFWILNKSLNHPVKVKCKIIDLYTKDEIEQFKMDFENICHELTIEKMHKWSDSSDWEIKGKTKNEFRISENFICAQPFSRLTILFNGDVTPCCVDWSHKLVIGNIMDNSLDYIWNNNANFIRHQHIKGQFVENSPCNNCDYMFRSSKFDKLFNKDKKLNEIYNCL